MKTEPKPMTIMQKSFGCATIIVLSTFALGYCVGPADDEQPAAIAEKPVAVAPTPKVDAPKAGLSSAELAALVKERAVEIEKADRAMGLHCKKNGDVAEANAIIKDALPNPAAFEVTSTLVGQVKPDGMHPLVVHFTTLSPQGEALKLRAAGVIESKSCAIKSLKILEVDEVLR